MMSPTRPSPPPPTATPPATEASPAGVGDLAGIERSVTSKAHRAVSCLLMRPRELREVWLRELTLRTIARAAAVEVCEPRQGREAAALSIPSRRRGFNLKSPARLAPSHDDFSRNGSLIRTPVWVATAG